MATPALLFTQNANFDVERTRQLQDEQRQQNLAINWGVINNPDASDQDKLAARNAIQNLYPSAAHGPLFINDLKNLAGKVFGHHPQGQPMPTVAPPPTTPNPVDVLQQGTRALPP